MAAYLRPTSLVDALAALENGAWSVVAGGTDYYPARVGRPLDDDVLDISALPDLRAIRLTDDGWRIPALATWSDVISAELPPIFDGLKAAAREVGGVQIQNAGTVCGNLCNASPAADGVPPLLSLNASVELVSQQGVSTMPLAEFALGNRRTALRPGQLMQAVVVPASTVSRARGHFLKLGARRYLVISIVMVGAVLEADADGNITRAAIAVGACSEVAQRLPDLEAALVGQPAGAGLGDLVKSDHVAHLAPIDDPRGTAEYRQDAALTLCRRALAELGEVL